MLVDRGCSLGCDVLIVEGDLARRRENITYDSDGSLEFAGLLVSSWV